MFKIFGTNSIGITECLDETDNENDAFYLVSEYQIAFDDSWVIWYE